MPPTTKQDQREHLWQDAGGAVFVEKLIVYIPLMLTFFLAWELAELCAAHLVVQRASSAAGRAAVVVLPDDPTFYNGEPVDSYDGQRRDDIELAAGMILSANPRFSDDFDVEVGDVPDTAGPLDVTLTASWDCGAVSILCGGDGAIELSSKTTHTYQPAKYVYTELASADGNFHAGARGGDLAGDEDDPYRQGKRKRDDCDSTCKDPTANIKPSPSLKNCQMKPPDQKGPTYTYGNKGTKKCNIEAVYLDPQGNVTYCFNSYGTAKGKNGARNEGIADGAIKGKTSSKCPAGTKWSVEYEPVKVGGTDSARVDLSPYAVSGSTVLVPATVSGPARAGSDDSQDFKFSWDAFRKANPQYKDMSNSALDKKFAGYTWHHNKVVKIGDKYYYEMMLVPTTLHESAPHAGGSSWIRGAGATQTPDDDPANYTPPTSSGTDLLKPNPGKPKGC